jgi:putative colanic acid biosynthesis UDP-glucose lipid carrier transferase
MLKDPFSGMLRSHSSSLAVLQRLLDMLIIYFGLVFATSIRNIPLDSDYLLLMSLAGLLFLLLAEIQWMYRSWRTEKLMNEFGSVIGIWCTVVLCLILLGFATKTSSGYSRLAMAIWAIVVPVAMVLARLIYRKSLRILRAGNKNIRTVAFFGCGKTANKMAAHINEVPWMGLKVLGAFDDRPLDRIEPGALSFEGDMQNLVHRARTGAIHIVYITLPMHAEQRIACLVEQLSDTTVSVYVVPDSFAFDLFHARWSSLAGVPVVSVHESPFYGIHGWIKRAEDLIIGSVILVLISLLMLVIAVGIKLTSRGSVLFKQRRYGLNGEIVEVWKFRSMTACDDGATVVQAKRNDVRITPFGAFLRRTSLDELPQFINVLQGKMSIVGPRPHAIAHNEQYRGQIQGYMLRHKVKPGITGWAQINGWRGETDKLDKMKGRIDYDLDYVHNWSLWLDIKIICMTVFKGFIGKNAY